MAPWITVLSRHTHTQYSQRGGYITNLLLCDIPRNRHHAQAHVTSGALLALSLAARTDVSVVFNNTASLRTYVVPRRCQQQFHGLLPPQVLFFPVHGSETHNNLPCLRHI